jgi:hypothetical protein
VFFDCCLAAVLARTSNLAFAAYKWVC